ncbi:MAG: cadherin repeat domain-containing protein, partial [Thermoplasmatota archaeon]
KTYFWTVIPNDGCSYGECDSGVLSFRVNYKPTFKEIEDQKASAGADFKYKIYCTDQDTEDIPNLRYSLKEAPEGMTISEETGMIRWKPKDDQAMLHTVEVEVSDGIETNTATFRIEVGEGGSSSSSLLIIIAIVIIVVILIAIGVFFIFRQKKKMDEEALKKGEEERAALEKEREEEYLSYEELYGVPAPEKEEEGMTTTELKDYIHGQIEELEEG